jgi:ribosome maturation factor RimP
MSWQAALERTITGMGYDLVDVERSAGGLLRVTIDRLPGHAYPTGPGEFVLVEDCELVTRQLQYLLEVENVDYHRLEVSSPGLDRPLRKPADWQRFVGHEVEITLRQPFEGRRKWRGLLAASVGTAQAGEAVEGAPAAWRLLLAPEPAPRKPVRGQPRPKARPAEAGEPELVLDFSLDEVREARLVPVLDFKGRRTAAPEAAEAQPAIAEKQDGGQD